MKILLAAPCILPEVGGPSYSVSSIFNNLLRISEQVSLVTKKDQGGEYVSAISRDKFISGFDVVHNFSVWSSFTHSISASANRKGVPQIFCPMGMLEPWSLEQKKLKKKIAWLLYQHKDIERSAAVHATSSLEAHNLRALGVQAPIAVIPHGIDIPINLPIRADDSSGGETRTALFLSRIHPKKGLLELVEVWALLRPKGWRLVIAGPDADGYAAVVSAAIARYHLQECVSMIGQVFGEEKARLFHNADLFVLPTHSENFGLVIPEALSYSVPVITTTGAPWGELLETGSGWWIELSVESLVQAVEEAVKLSRHELRAMGMRGRQLVNEKYGWETIIHKNMQLYHWIVSGRDTPDFILE